jgi:hypothetical protein
MIPLRREIVAGDELMEQMGDIISAWLAYLFSNHNYVQTLQKVAIYGAVQNI